MAGDTKKGSSLQDVSVVLLALCVAGTLFANRERSPWVVPAVVLLSFATLLFLTHSDVGKGDRTLTTRRASIVCLTVWSFWIITGSLVPYTFPRLYAVSLVECVVSVWICAVHFDPANRRVRGAVILAAVLFLVPVSAAKDLSSVELLVHSACFVAGFYGLLYLRIHHALDVHTEHLACSSAWMLCTPIWPFAAVYALQLAYTFYLIQRGIAVEPEPSKPPDPPKSEPDPEQPRGRAPARAQPAYARATRRRAEPEADEPRRRAEPEAPEPAEPPEAPKPREPLNLEEF